MHFDLCCCGPSYEMWGIILLEANMKYFTIDFVSTKLQECCFYTKLFMPLLYLCQTKKLLSSANRQLNFLAMSFFGVNFIVHIAFVYFFTIQISSINKINILCCEAVFNVHCTSLSKVNNLVHTQNWSLI